MNELNKLNIILNEKLNKYKKQLSDGKYEDGTKIPLRVLATISGKVTGIEECLKEIDLIQQ